MSVLYGYRVITGLQGIGNQDIGKDRKNELRVASYKMTEKQKQGAKIYELRLKGTNDGLRVAG
jgi:hypothetical protein